MVTEATMNKYATELLNLYVSLYQEKYASSPKMNRHKHRWGFKAMYEDFGLPQSKRIIQYYFRTQHLGHPLEYLLYNYENLCEMMIAVEQDAIKREELRAETEKRVREWEARGNN